MKIEKASLLLLIIISILVINFYSVSAVESGILQNEVESCLNQSEVIISKLQNDGFSIIRVNDTLSEAKLLYQSQKSSRSGKINLSRIIVYCNEIQNLSQQAYIARDSFQAMTNFYNQSITEDMNTTSLDRLIEQIDNEIKSERYEKVDTLVDLAYDEISRTQSEFSTLNVVYRNTTRSLKIFFEKNWLTLSVLFILAVIMFLAYRTKVKHWIVERKIANLETRKSTIKSLITKIQTDYFHSGTISESEYNIKTKKFAELIRDIDRQIPLLYEQLAKTGDNFKKYVNLKDSSKDLKKPDNSGKGIIKLDKK
jgi:hypothetical protein